MIDAIGDRPGGRDADDGLLMAYPPSPSRKDVRSAGTTLSAATQFSAAAIFAMAPISLSGLRSMVSAMPPMTPPPEGTTTPAMFRQYFRDFDDDGVSAQDMP